MWIKMYSILKILTNNDGELKAMWRQTLESDDLVSFVTDGNMLYARFDKFIISVWKGKIELFKKAWVDNL